MIRSVDQDHSTRSQPVFRAVRFPPDSLSSRPDIPPTAVPAFLRRARSALYRVQGDPQPMSPIDAFRAAADRRPDSGGFWRGQIKILHGYTGGDHVAGA
jgi:hypothetical protein